MADSRDKKYRLTLGYKILLGILPVVFLSVILGGIVNYYVARGRVLTKVQTEIEASSRQVSTALKYFLEQRERDLETLADVPLFLDYSKNMEYGLLAEAESYRNEIERYFLTFNTRSEVYNLIAYFDSQGVPVAAVQNGKSVRNLNSSSFKDAAVGGSRFQISSNELFYSKPLFNRERAHYGTLMFKCNLSFVEKILMNAKFGEGGGAYLMDAQKKKILGDSPDTKDALVGSSEIQGFPWTVVVCTNPNTFLGTLAQIRNLTIVFSAVTGIFLCAIFILVIRNATRPISDMVQGTQELARGNLSYRLSEPDAVELKSLAASFNEMAGSLQRHNEDLEFKIRENAVLLDNLSQSEARYRSVLENSPVAVLGLSNEQRIVTWNRGAEQIFGFSEQDIVGKPLTALFPLEAQSEFNALLAQMMAQGHVRDYALSGITKSGKKLDLSLSWGGSYPDFWMNKEWSVVIRDVTDAKRLQEQVIRSEKLSAVGQLLSSIAHELNNPLQAVVGYSQLLSQSKKKSKDDLRLIIENAMRCRKIIQNLLLFVRHGEIVKEPVKVQKAVSDAIELLQYKLSKSANIALTVRIPEDLPMVQADLQQIQQVFVNLINNACDAMFEWEGPKAMKISAAVNGPMVRVEFEDTGPGISAESQKKIFEPFFTTKPEGRGTGLGLTVCHQILEDHGGSLGFHTVPGGGTTFWVDIPIAKGGARSPVAQESAPKTAGKTVLVVDDEADILACLSKALKLDGCGVLEASSFAEAVDWIRKKSFDLVVADIHLGDGTGFHLYESWGKRTGKNRPPFLLLTGDILSGSIEKSIADCSIPILHKPVDVNEFQQTVRLLLSGKTGVPS